MDTGDRIRELRRKKGLRQSDLADRIGCSTQVISNIERGVSRATADLAARMATVLGVPADDIVKDNAPISDYFSREEKAIIQNYRKLLPEEQKMFSHFLESYLQIREK